ncbi:MAG: glycosyltransferase family 2 protein [Actinomycetota bacterium]
MPELAIVVVSYGSSALLERHLAATAAAVPEARVVVVDNFSTADERRAVEALTQRMGWTLVAVDGNAGFGGGVNRGMADALAHGASAVLVLNPDASIDRAGITTLAAAGDARTLRSPVVRTPEGGVWFAGADVDLVDGDVRSTRRRAEHPDGEPVPWLSGACLWITREVWELVGGFDDDYFLYWEDVDFSRRVVERGGSLLVVEDAIAVHDEGGTHRGARQRSEAKSELYYYWNIRNRMRFAVGHLDAEGIRRWQRASVPAAWRIILRGGRRQLLLQPVPPLRALWRGLRDGRRLAEQALIIRGRART